MIAIVDYGVGNLFSLKSSFAMIGADIITTSDEAVIRQADRIVLPGVGAFEDAAAKLRATGLDKVVCELAAEGKPILGICLGMQMLFDRSLEYGEHPGLGLIPGTIRPIADVIGPDLKIPHIGWNALHILRDDPIFKYVEEGECVYYVHSFYGKDCEASTLATSEYGLSVTGVVRQGLVWGTQFHPEKSGTVGLQILRNFCEMEG